GGPGGRRNAQTARHRAGGEPWLLHQERSIRRDDPILLAEADHFVLDFNRLAVQPELLQKEANLPAGPELRHELELLLRRGEGHFVGVGARRAADVARDADGRFAGAFVTAE